MKETYFRYLKKEIPVLCLLGFITLALAASVAVGVYLWKIIFDQLFRQPDGRLFTGLVIFSLAAVIATSFFSVAKDRVHSLLQRNLAFRVRSDFIEEALHYRYAYFLEHNSAEFVKRAMEDCQIIADSLSKSVLGIVNAIQIGFWLVMFAFLVPWLSLSYGVLLGLFVGWVVLWRQKYEISTHEIANEYGLFWKHLGSIFSNIKLIKLELLQGKVIRELDANLSRKSRKFRTYMFYNSMLWNIVFLMVWLPVAAVLFIFSGDMARGAVSIGTIVFCLLFNERFITPLHETIAVLISLQGLKAARERVAEFRKGEREPEGDAPLRSIREKIEFRDVSFVYPGNRFKLEDVSLEIPAGTHVAVTGKSGSGKSTLASLLVRLYDPTSGSILIDGVPSPSFRLESLRRTIVLLPQEIVVYAGTIRDNIDVHNELDDQTLLEVVRRVRLDGFLDRQPAGLATLIGEGVVDISGGERQRLGIARVLALNAPFYVFDEATASLDKELEKEMAALLYRPGAGFSSLTITHNPHLLGLMDRVYRLEEGRIRRER